MTRTQSTNRCYRHRLLRALLRDMFYGFHCYPVPAALRHVSFGAGFTQIGGTAQFVAPALLAITSIVGCGQAKTPEAPVAKLEKNDGPRPAPTPSDLTETEVARLIQPAFRDLYRRAFDPRSLRWNGNPLSRNIAKERLFEWDISSESDARRESDSAKEDLLGIYLRQAISDARNRNYHRSHVLFSDIAEERSRKRSGQLIAAIAEFFVAVPDREAVEVFGDTLLEYVEEQGKNIVFIGEHAATMKAAGFDAVSDFERRELVTQLEEITIPMIRQAEGRAESYGFSASRLTQSKRRLQSLLSPLKESLADHAVGVGLVPKAMDLPLIQEYSDLFGVFEKYLNADNGSDGGQVESLARQIEKLWDSKRPIAPSAADVAGGWLAEKQICAASCKDFIVWPKLGLEIGCICPVKWDAENKQLVDDADEAFSELYSAEHVAAVKEWCRKGEYTRTANECRSGAFYYLLGWYFLECEDSARARKAFIYGAQLILDRLEDIRLDAKRDDSQLVSEINAYRLLIAAAGINSSEPGSLASTSSYLAELRVLLKAWRQRWLLSGFPQSQAQTAIDNCNKAIDLLQKHARERPELDRYFFLDYRFRHGAIPDVLVDDALRRRVFQPENAAPKQYTKLMFHELGAVPTTFGEETIGLWSVRKDRRSASADP